MNKLTTAFAAPAVDTARAFFVARKEVQAAFFGARKEVQDRHIENCTKAHPEYGADLPKIQDSSELNRCNKLQ